MAIILNGINEKNKIVQVCFTENEDEYFMQNMKNIEKTNSKYYIHTNLWDCAGDFALRLCICKAQGKALHSKDKRMILYASNEVNEDMQYYSPDMLIMIFSKLDDWEKDGNFTVKTFPIENVEQVLIDSIPDNSIPPTTP